MKNMQDDKFSRFRNKKNEKSKFLKSNLQPSEMRNTAIKSGELLFSENSAQSKKIEKICLSRTILCHQKFKNEIQNSVKR